MFKPLLLAAILGSAVAATGSSFAAVALSRWHDLQAAQPQVAHSLQRRLQGNNTPISCEACEFIVGVAIESAGNATTYNEIKQIIAEGCTVIGDPTVQGLCTGLLDALLDLAQTIDKELVSLAWDVPLGFCSTIFPVCTIPCCDSADAPEQVHLALTASNGSAMTVQWVTLNASSAPLVTYWPTAAGNATPSSAPAAISTYTQGGWIGVIYTAVMTGLQQGTLYSYWVGSTAGGRSQVYTFNTFPANIGTPERPLRVLQIGDMAYDNASDATVAAMINLTESGSIDLVQHIGDISYADGFMKHWDVFMRKIELVSARLPYHVCQGNHEIWFNFTSYRARFAMPPAKQYTLPNGTVVGGMNNNSYHSLDIGPLHLVFFDTETALDAGNVDQGDQLAWLEADLGSVHRDVTPWVVAGAHRPLYCTNDGGKDTDCNVYAPLLRSQAEHIFLSTRTDLVLAAHMHGYERTWPVSQGVPCAPGSNCPQAANITLHTYTSSPYVAYIVNGAAGNREGNTDPSANAAWSVPSAHTAARGYGIYTVTAGQGAGATALQYTFYDANGTAIDTLTLLK